MSDNQKNNKEKPPCTILYSGNFKNCQSSFYTKWSFYAIVVTSMFGLIAIPFFYKIPIINSSKIASYLVLSIIIGFSINSIAVAIVSQFLIHENLNKLDKNEKRDIKWYQTLNNSNLQYHLLPLILAILLLVAITTVPWSGNKMILFIISSSVPIIFYIIWASISLPDGKNSRTTILTKANIIYNNPNDTCKLLLPLSIIVFSAIYIFIMRGGNKNDLKKFN